MSNRLIFLSKKLIEKESEQGMRTLFNQTDLSGRSLRCLIKQHPCLLQKLETIIYTEWEGVLCTHSLLPMKLSSIFMMVYYNPSSMRQLTSLHWERPSSFSNPLQFYLFRRSPLLKYHLQLLSLFSITLFVLITAFQAAQAFQDTFQDFSTQPTNEQLLASKTAVQKSTFYMSVCIPIIWSVIIQDFLELIFQCLTTKKAQFLSAEIMLSGAMAITSIIALSSYTYNLYSVDDSKLQNYYQVMTIGAQFNYTLSYSYSLLNGLLIIRFLFMFRLNSTVGPLLKVCAKMARDVFNFSILLFLTLILFSSVGVTLFPTAQFISLSQSFLTLFRWMLGNIDFQELQDQGAAGKIFMILFIFVSLIVLLNLLIAILSSTYASLGPQSLGLYLQSLISQYPKWAYHPSHNVFTFRVPSLSLLSLFCLPCIRKGKSKLSLFLQHIYYIPAFLLILIFMTILNFLCLPLAWPLLVISRFQERRPKLAIASIFAFPFVALFFIIDDVILNAKRLWLKPHILQTIEKVEASQTEVGLQQEDSQFLSSIFKRESEEIRLKDVNRSVREKLELSLTYREIEDWTNYKSNPEELLDQTTQEGELVSFKYKSFKRYLTTVEEREAEKNWDFKKERFIRIKQFLKQCAWENQQRVFLVCPQKVLSMIAENEMMKRIREITLYPNKKKEAVAPETDK